MTYPEELSKKGRTANPYFCLMGIDAVSFGDGNAVLSMEVRPDMLNGAGWLQGGVYVSLIDEAMALAIYTLLNEKEGIATISENTNFYKGVRDGKIFAKAYVVRRGRKIIFAEGFCYPEGEESKPLARTTASFAAL
ncbi:MAG: PaaI family thioesterase [Methanomicrobium sp.]|nr:PaaI family thioesterase [Methanomicrobium sp.]